MALIPLEKRLRKGAHRKLAFAQDALVNLVYETFPKAVIHGGTAIWRCYSGKRFSEDVDLYLPPASVNDDKLKEFVSFLKKNGFSVVKFKHTKRSIFSKLGLAGATLSLEAVTKNIKNVAVKPFEASDGTFMNVYTLAPEDLIVEKVEAYKSRGKVRDLYDVWFLLSLVENPRSVKRELEEFVKEFKEPKDYATLKALIVIGPVPAVEDLIGGIKSWARRNT